jgi:tetraacyldisaccharide 4'-kinase
MAGIAGPERFFDSLREAGWTIAGTASFADHYRYRARDLAEAARAARAAGAAAIMTTEKDLMRLLPLRPWPLPVWWVPMSVRVEPAEVFGRWLAGRLSDERAGARGVSS